MFLIEFLCELRVLGGKKKVDQQIKKMRNEPNPVLSEVEWIKQITHFINEQRTMPALPALSKVEGSSVEGNNEHFSNEPNPVLSEVEWIKQITHFINEQRKMNYEQLSNEPNFDKTNYEQLSNEPNLKNHQINLSSVKTKNYNNEQRIMSNKRLQNEPNFNFKLQMHPNKAGKLVFS